MDILIRFFQDKKIAVIMGAVLVGIGVILHSITIPWIHVEGSKAEIRFYFFMPMKLVNHLEDHISILDDHNENKNISYTAHWENRFILVVLAEETNLPKGQQVSLSLEGLPTILGIKKNMRQRVQFAARPEVTDVSPKDIMGTEGPLIITFNTNIDKESIKQYIECNFPFELQPAKDNDNDLEDFTRWRITPVERLKNERNYIILMKRGLQAQCGLQMPEEKKIEVFTASKPKFESILPKDGETNVGIYPKIAAAVNEPIQKGIVEFLDTKGKVMVRDEQIEFLPNELLEWDKEYRVILQAVSKVGEKSDPVEIRFQTMKIGEDQLWVEVVLGDEHRVIIHKGDEVIRRMKASGGIESEPSVFGTFYLQDRGEYFYSERFQEGAAHWVRIIDQYLFHGIPRDKDWNIKEEELSKLGKAASHGCIRLSEEDAEWFYENVPEKTMVVIYKKNNEN